MGMFDYVNAPTLPCKKCAEPIDEWQSKDGSCECETIGMGDVNHFCGWCENCSTMNDYFRDNNPRPDDINDFELEDS